MAGMNAINLQATLFDFAIGELVRQHRESFQPLWSAESWAKLMIWLSLNCGCSGDRGSLEAYAEALGPGLTGRMRRIFFERELDDLELRVLADPAESQVLVLPLGPAGPLEHGRVAAALERVGLLGRVAVEPQSWKQLEAALALPWQERS
jgi:hypothetical protein